MKRLLLVRHCESQALAGEVPAHVRDDSRLSGRGLRQAEQVAARWSDQPLDLVLASPFLRAQQTAQVLAQSHNAPVFSSTALAEYLLRDDEAGVERVEHGVARALGFILPFHPFYECAAVVAHNGILTTLLAALLNAPFEEVRDVFQEPGASRLLRYDWERHGDQNWRIVESFTPDLAP